MKNSFDDVVSFAGYEPGDHAIAKNAGLLFKPALFNAFMMGLALTRQRILQVSPNENTEIRAISSSSLITYGLLKDYSALLQQQFTDHVGDVAREIALSRMMDRVRLVEMTEKHASELCKDLNDDQRCTLMRYFLLKDELADDLKIDLKSLFNRPIGDADALRDALNIKMRMDLYGEDLIALGREICRINQDPAYMQSSSCSTLAKIAILMSEYDYMASELRWPSALAKLSKAGRGELIERCNRYLTQPMNGYESFWRDVQTQAQRVKDMVQKDLYTPSYLRA